MVHNGSGRRVGSGSLAMTTGFAMCVETGTSSGGSGAIGLTARLLIGHVSVAMSTGAAAAFATSRLARSLVHSDSLHLFVLIFTFHQVLLFEVLGSQVLGQQLMPWTWPGDSECDISLGPRSISRCARQFMVTCPRALCRNTCAQQK